MTAVKETRVPADQLAEVTSACFRASCSSGLKPAISIRFWSMPSRS